MEEIGFNEDLAFGEAPKSYTYTLFQKIVSGICAICTLAGLIVGGTYLFVNLLDIIVK